MKRTVFFVSDHTAITAETFGRSLLSQFEHIEFERITQPFVDCEAKAQDLCRRITEAYARDGQAPLVFSTLTDERLRHILKDSEAVVFDLFEAFLDRMETTLGQPSAQAIGRAHGLGNATLGRGRVEALKFAIDCDDGVGLDAYDKADIILIGVSRSGKTPACLFLALHYGIKAANYPLTDEDLKLSGLPANLRLHRKRLFGLTMTPERLHQLREERRPTSRYASLDQCRNEIRAAEALFRSAGIPYLDTSTMSVEEIAANILHHSGLKRVRW
ncbi:posphoenolpyruvate synthetase regulatory kinase/phosphorylase PpsR [Methylocaldum szegediense]|uniref:Putative phosphoenolpyruvate synthase regulatory protein n=1 Tax=Methylocaldum szegediense TaxID=73780 RepID=A0ABN8X731_9GAMM|nr:pyruvate, water dikinase regulatory protein [Methylocaldum szegediense]CAI8918182.1 phosphoenolpyruvate synthetase regulatory protein [Methylocaldum szegediense]